MSILKRFIAYLKSIHIQKYINAIIIFIGLAADIISLALFFGAIQSPPTQSNFYVNNREFLAWVLVAIIYSLGLINAWVRRRWKEKFGNEKGDNSIFNFFAILELSNSHSSNYEKHKIKWKNFQRDFSFLFIILFPIVFLFSRALTATETTTSITGSPWGDLQIALFHTTWVSILMMVVTSMFDFAMSMFVGDK
ncbi:hypothetical protein [Candidatus Leptofilum sp.]|uniref:hypothetical protein n=1 Tax=Candidatus Leptofilum sp. TaxID=3241576 RepID=UPI003B5BF252